MLYIIEILILYVGIMTIKYLKLKEKNKINYSNYQNCLKSLAETDPSLADYLRSKNQ